MTRQRKPEETYCKTLSSWPDRTLSGSSCSTTRCCVAFWTVESISDQFRTICRNRLCLLGLLVGISLHKGFSLAFPSPWWIANQGWGLHTPFATFCLETYQLLGEWPALLGRRVQYVRMKQDVLAYMLLAARLMHVYISHKNIKPYSFYTKNYIVICNQTVDKKANEPRHDKTNKVTSAQFDQSLRCSLNG